MRLTIIESPFAAADAEGIEANIAYARACVRDSVLRGEAPSASHLLLTQIGILDDTIPAERQLGIDAGLAWRRVADVSAVYTDRGITKGMEYGIAAARTAGIPVEYRSLGQSAASDAWMAATARDLACRLDAIAHLLCDRGSPGDRWHARQTHGLIHEAAAHLSLDEEIRAIARREALERAGDRA